MKTAHSTWSRIVTQFAFDVADQGRSTALSVSLMHTKMNLATVSATVCSVDQLALISQEFVIQYAKLDVMAPVPAIALIASNMPRW